MDRAGISHTNRPYKSPIQISHTNFPYKQPRAGLMSPLANYRPRQPHPHTYAPAGYAPSTSIRDDLLRSSGYEMTERQGLGGTGGGGGGRQGLGGGGRIDSSEARARGMMGAMGGGSFPGGEPAHVPSLLRPLTGAFAGSDYNDDIGGLGGHQTGPMDESSMAALCERRLFFELSSLPRPDEAVRQVLHRLRDFAARQQLPPFYMPPEKKLTAEEKEKDNKDKDRDRDRGYLGYSVDKEKENREKSQSTDKDPYASKVTTDKKDKDKDKEKEVVLPPASYLTAGHVSCEQLRDALSSAGLVFTSHEVIEWSTERHTHMHIVPPLTSFPFTSSNLIPLHLLSTPLHPLSIPIPLSTPSPSLPRSSS